MKAEVAGSLAAAGTMAVVEVAVAVAGMTGVAAAVPTFQGGS
jgi:hypothetical protein